MDNQDYKQEQKPKQAKSKTKKIVMLLGLVVIIIFVWAIVNGVSGWKEDANKTKNSVSGLENSMEKVEEKINELDNENSNTAVTNPTLLDYEIVGENDVSYAGCKRATFKVTVPDDATQADVDYTLNDIINSKKAQWDDITVWAYKNSEKDSVGLLPYSKGMKEFSTCE